LPRRGKKILRLGLGVKSLGVESCWRAQEETETCPREKGERGLPGEKLSFEHWHCSASCTTGGAGGALIETWGVCRWTVNHGELGKKRPWVRGGRKKKGKGAKKKKRGGYGGEGGKPEPVTGIATAGGNIGRKEPTREGETGGSQAICGTDLGQRGCQRADFRSSGFIHWEDLKNPSNQAKPRCTRIWAKLGKKDTQPKKTGDYPRTKKGNTYRATSKQMEKTLGLRGVREGIGD